ncbi:MAG: anti-sigma factor family protein [Bryobacteraceae bacterium]
MTCFSAKRQITAFVDKRLRDGECSRIDAHLRKCDRCASHFEQIASLRSASRELPKAVAPAHLINALRVIASRERQVIEQNQGSQLRAIWSRWKFRMDEMIRPLTIPATGGLLSSFILFGTLAFTIGTATRTVSYDVPVLYGDTADANLVPLQLGSGAVVLTITTDSNGRIRDYAVRDGADSFTGDPARLHSDNIVLPQFPTVLALAHPISGDIRISFTPLELRQ